MRANTADMTNDQWNNPSIIRQYVDGEFSAEQTAEFERIMSQRLDLQHAVEFERQLRGSVGRVMAETRAAPAELHDVVVRGLDELDQSGDAAAMMVETNAPAVIGRVGGDQAERGVLANPIRANIFAVAASLALVAGAILFGLLVPQIDNWGRRDSVPVSQMEAPAWFSKQHCTSAAMGGRMVAGIKPFTTIETAQSGLSTMLGRPVTVFDLGEVGYELEWAAPCKVCEEDERITGRMMYKRCVEGLPTVYASVFIVPVEYGIGADANAQEWETAATLEECRTKVVRHRADGFVYYLTACDPRDFQLLEVELLRLMDEADARLPSGR